MFWLLLLLVFNSTPIDDYTKQVRVSVNLGKDEYVYKDYIKAMSRIRVLLSYPQKGYHLLSHNLTGLEMPPFVTAHAMTIDGDWVSRQRSESCIMNQEEL